MFKNALDIMALTQSPPSGKLKKEIFSFDNLLSFLWKRPLNPSFMKFIEKTKQAFEI